MLLFSVSLAENGFEQETVAAKEDPVTESSDVTIINVASVAVECVSFLLEKYLPSLARNAGRRMKDAWSYGTNQSFNCVSAILLSTRLGERYSKENTFLFLNPFALQSIKEDVFKDIVIWKTTDGVSYTAYLGGEKLGE